MRIILAGYIDRFPLVGHAWITSQYLLGLRSLGHDVYYLEDSGEESWVYEWSREEMTNGINYPATFIARMLYPIGTEGRWIYWTSHHSAGMSLDELRSICQAADLLLFWHMENHPEAEGSLAISACNHANGLQSLKG